MSHGTSWKSSSRQWYNSVLCGNFINQNFKNSHFTIDKCYFLHPELAPEGWTNFADKQPKLANLALKPKSTSNDGADIMGLRATVLFENSVYWKFWISRHILRGANSAR